MKWVILFVTNNYRPYSGGVVHSIDATVQELRASGHDVYIVCPQFFDAHPDDQEYIIRLPSLFRFMYKQNYMAVPWRPYYHLARVCNVLKPHIVHVHHPFMLGPVAVAYAKSVGVKVVFTYHTMYEAYAHYALLPRWVMAPMIEKTVIKFCKTVDHIVAPSHGIQQHLIQHGVTAVTVIPSGLRTEFRNPQFLPKKLNKPYQLLYVGRFVQEKNIPFLVDVIAQLPDEYHMTFVGYGSDTEYIKRYIYSVRGLSAEQVKFVIKPDVGTLLEAYRSAHLFLFPSQTDTQGLVLAESMACSTPVVALDGVGQRDLVRHGKNGFLVNSVTEMSDMVRRICADSNLYLYLQVGAWEASQAYDAQVLTDRLMILYGQLIDPTSV